MSFSQKHSGKVLVPWFNIAEWNFVYDLIYSENSQDWSKALQILKIWKHRTPLLSAGVEGTLIVLEALLVNTTQLSTYETSHIFSTSLVRFLNLCAANSDKQGTFYKTAMKNELPKWLVSIRHDIAHSHKVPSESMLMLSLKFCLEWLKGKYWDVQCENMVDFVANKPDNSIIDDAVYIYKHLNDTKMHNSKMWTKCIDRFTRSNKQVSSKKIIENVDTDLRDFIRRNKAESIEKISTLLLDQLLILDTESGLEENGSKKISAEFLTKWRNLINVIYEADIMPDFIFKMFNFVCDHRHSLNFREIASLWIKEIFVCLIKKENNDEDKTGLYFVSGSNSMKNKDFVNMVLTQLNPFTSNFLKEVLQYNNAPSQFIDDSTDLVAAFSAHCVLNSEKIYTVDDLDFNEGSVTPSVNGKTQQSKSRWTIIEDTAQYLNLPLGVLPHQNRNINPLLDV